MSATRLLAAALVVSLVGCTPISIGGIALGATGVVGARMTYRGGCKREACEISNALALVMATVGVGLITGGGTYLALKDID